MRKLLLALTLTLFCASSVFADGEQIYVFDNFSAGLNTKQSQTSLNKSQSTVAENCRFSTEQNALSKRDQVYLYGTADTTEPINGMHRLYLNDGTKVIVVAHGDEIEKGNDSTGAFTTILNLSSGDHKWQFLTWHNILIGTDGYNYPIKWDGTSASATYLGSCLGTDAGSGAGPNGAYTYKVTFYTSSYEVLMGPASNTVTVTDNDINLTMIPIGPDSYLGEAVVGRKVYRSGAGDTTYKLLSNGTINNNTAVILTDSDADAERGAAYPAADGSTVFSEIVPKGKLCLIHSDRLFLANDPSYPSRVYYGDSGSHDYFPPLNYVDVRPSDGDEITLFKVQLGKAVIGKNNTIQKFYTEGDDPAEDWSLSDPLSFIGCKAMYSAVNTPIGILYLGSDGIYRFDGQYSTLVSDQITPEIRDISETNFSGCWGEYHRNTYYLSYPSRQSGSSTNNRVFVYDLLNKAYSIDILSVNAFCTFNSGTDWDTLYSGSSEAGKIYAHSLSSYEVIHKKHSDLTGTFTEARYIPVSVGGDANSPVIELSRNETIDELVGTIDDIEGAIDRDSATGSYVSQVLNIGASSFDKIYWNESIPVDGGDVTFAIRSGESVASCEAATFSSEYSNPAGSDISALTAGAYVQYRASLTTSSLAKTPTLYKANNYVVRLVYGKEGSSVESSIPFHWTSGWFDLGFPAQKKTLKKLEVYYESENAGTLSIKFDTYDGASDTFEIDLSANSDHYEEYFTSGALVGNLFKMDIQNSDLNPLKIKRVICVYTVEPLV
jgi:hypothetical protein